MSKSLIKSIPQEVLEIFGDAPILSTEESTRYHAMIAAFAKHIDPGDFITWTFIKDLADHRTEMWRYRRIKAETVENAHRNVIEKRVDEFESALAKAPADIRSLAVAEANEEIARRGLQGDEHRKHLEELETKIEADVKAQQASLQRSLDHWNTYEPSEGDLAGQLHVWIGQHRVLDELISVAEERYAQSLEDLQRHVFGFGRALHEKVHEIIDADVTRPDGTKVLEDTGSRTKRVPFGERGANDAPKPRQRRLASRGAD